MSLESGLRTFLLAQAGISALVGSGAQARVHSVRLPQRGKFPAITIQRISGTRIYAHDGPSQVTPIRVQVDVWANENDGADALAQQIRIALSGYAGAAGTETLRACFLSNERHSYSDVLEIHRRSLDFELWHEEAQS